MRYWMPISCRRFTSGSLLRRDTRSCAPRTVVGKQVEALTRKPWNVSRAFINTSPVSPPSVAVEVCRAVPKLCLSYLSPV